MCAALSVTEAREQLVTLRKACSKCNTGSLPYCTKAVVKPVAALLVELSANSASGSAMSQLVC